MPPVDNKKVAKPTVLTRGLALFTALTILAFVILYLSMAEDEIDIETAPTHSTALPVSFELVKATDHAIKIETYGSVKPRWSANVTAAVSGRIIEVANAALAGGRVDKGTKLARIEPSRYAAELANAELAVQEAELSLWQARNENLLAKKRLARAGSKAPNALSLKLPQLNIAKASLRSAEARKIAAEQQLTDTIIRAPFSGFVTDRIVSPGQSVNAGEKLLTLIDDKVFEITLQISSKDWSLLDHPLKDQQADILDADGGILAKATIRETAGFLDKKTRQHKIFLTLDANEYTQVRTGEFLRVSLPGKTISSAFSLPENARTQEGFVWFVDEHSRLMRSKPKVLFRTGGRIIVKVAELPEKAELRVITIPLASFLPGQKVLPQIQLNHKTVVQEQN